MKRGVLHMLARSASMAVVVALLAAAGSVHAKPSRVVSMNLCTDELVLLLADRAQIKSVSWLVQDPAMSMSADAARGLQPNHGLAEEIILLEPDLVVTGTFSNPATNAALKRLGMPVLEVGLATNLEEIRAQVREVAAALGRTARGEAVLEQMDARLARLTGTSRGKALTAIVYEPNGYAAGPGSLADEALKAAGLRNLAGELDLSSYSHFPLELLVLHRPDLLVLNRLDGSLPSIAEQIQAHPALHAAYREQDIISIPRQAWSCGNPGFLEAVERLHTAVRALVDEP